MTGMTNDTRDDHGTRHDNGELTGEILERPYFSSLVGAAEQGVSKRHKARTQGQDTHVPTRARASAWAQDLNIDSWPTCR